MNLNQTQREWAAFGGLVLVLAVAILGVALLAPGIFARVTGAFFGERVSAPVVETITPTPTAPPPSATPSATPLPPPSPMPETPSATAVPTQSYVVQPGDTLSRIAAQHNTTVALLVEINRLTNPNVLQPGTVLLIPQTAP